VGHSRRFWHVCARTGPYRSGHKKYGPRLLRGPCVISCTSAARASGVQLDPDTPRAPVRHTQPIIYEAFLSRSSASSILALRATAARVSLFLPRRFPRRVGDEFLVIELGHRPALMSASALPSFLSSRAFSAERSITAFSAAKAATSPRTSNCTAPSARDLRRKCRRAGHPLDHVFQRCARPLVSADAPASTSRRQCRRGMFISARTERIAVTRSTTQPISASALDR